LRQVKECYNNQKQTSQAKSEVIVMPKKYRNFWNEKMETMSQDELHQLHEQKLLKQVKYAYENSLLYHEKFKAVGLEPGDMKGLDDLCRIPFTEKKEIREAQLSQPPVGKHRACPVSAVSRIYSSSGTTGVPTYIGLTKHDIGVYTEGIARFCWCTGIQPDSVVVNIPTAPFIADMFREGIEKTGAAHIPTGFNTERVIAAFQYQGANALHSTVSFWSYLLEEVQKRGINPRELGIQTIIGGAEGGTKAVRPIIEDGFGATVAEGMGMGEILCVIWGECVQNRGHGMHYIAQGLVHVELIDPETGQRLEVKDRATGEIIYTALENECMPLIRYRSRDHVTVVSTDKCDCGRTGYRIKVLGRTDDMLTVLGVNVYPLAIKDVVSNLRPKVSGEIEIQLEKPGPVVEPPLKIKVELGKEPGPLDSLKAAIDHLLREKLMFRADTELVPKLPRYQYKAKIIREAQE
jgi:phenylacetate-CoA ligase